ncbi:hypothetical protein LIER_09969 [Lithospermum erythrorhizon]|uniref:Reverse transcriptase Ty1/copia-type domain-containing protein n=1 Tax=Lithospermum erythrorhizon TaxID=34254 RepID=A0AAV3PJL6_LITER
MVTVRTFLVVAAAHQWELHQMDVHNSFLHGDLHEEGPIQLHVLVYLNDFIISGNDPALGAFKVYLGECFHMKDLGAKPSGFPIEQNHTLALVDGALFLDPERYRGLELWDVALRVVRYLKGSPGQGILLRSDCDFVLSGWCEFDWASCPFTRRSLTGWLVFLGGSPVY